MGCGGGKAAPAQKQLRDVYEVGEKLGEGAFGVVHEVVKKSTGDRFAVKMIDRALSDQSEVDREVEMLKAVEHQHTVSCVDVFVDNCFTYIVMPKFGGGDLVDGLQLHLRQKGKIPEKSYLPIVKQMATAIGFIHSKGVIHRDVKGDNFLMTKPDIADPECQVALSDFGTAVFLEQGTFLKEHTGTSVFWAPEVINKRYEFGADVWAMGVVYFGLIDGTFPFRDAKQILYKRMRIPKASKDSLSLLTGMLEKEPTKRLTAPQALKHRALGGGSKDKKEEASTAANGEDAVVPEPDASGDDEQAGPSVLDIKDKVPDAVIQARQAKLQNLEKDQLKAEKIRSGVYKDGDTLEGPPREFKALNFTRLGHRAGEKLKFEWWPRAKCVENGIVGISGTESQEVSTALGTAQGSGADASAIREILERNGVDTGKFGKGTAKTMEEFAHECHLGEAVLAEENKKLIRVVDVVVVRLEGKKGGGGGTKKLLVERSQEFADGRKRDVNRLPGTKRRPHESVRETALRVCSESLKLSTEDVEFKGAAEMFDEQEDSPSYPGIWTVYRKHLLKAVIVAKDSTSLVKVGLPKGNPFETELQESGGIKIAWGWFDEKKCKKMGVKVSVSGEASRYAGLVPAMMKDLTPEAVEGKFKKYEIDTSKYGIGEAKTFTEIANEVALGESDLMEEGGKLIRVVSVVLLRLQEPNGSFLIEHSSESKDGRTKQLLRLPGTKQRPHENSFRTARRVITTTLNFEDNMVTFDVAKSSLLQEEKESSSYPGLITVYRKNVVHARIGAPSQASLGPGFTSSQEAGSGNKVAPLTMN